MNIDDIMADSYRVLREVEWSGEDASCPCCYESRWSHAPDCDLAAILATEAGWKAHIARRNEILAQEDKP